MRRATLITTTMVVSILVGFEVANAQVEATNETLAQLKELSGFADWPGKSGLVRPYAKPSEEGIPLLASTTEVWPDRRPSVLQIQGGHVVRYHLRWEAATAAGFLDLLLTVANNCGDAQEYKIERTFNSTLPFEALVGTATPDEPTVTGDVSFGGGRHFIRNNVVVEVSADGEMADQDVEFARQLDAYLLTLPTGSTGDFKPMIREIRLARTPIRPGDVTELIVKAVDPQGGTLDYHWLSNGGKGGSIFKEGGRYYYRAWGETGTFAFPFTVITDTGFSSTAEVQVQISVF